MNGLVLRPGTLLSRGLAVALAAGILLAAWIGVASPWLERVQGDRQRLERQRTLLAGYERTASREDDARQKLATLTADTRGAGASLAGETSGQAAAALHDRIKSVAAASGAQLTSAQALPPSTAAPNRLGLRATVVADTVSLQALLHALETTQPIIVVDTLHVRPRQSSAGDVLDVQLEAFGFARSTVR